MSATVNEDAANANANQPGEFSSKVAPQPQHEPGHQPGKLVGKDAIPESNIQVLPPGTAPASNTFQPQNENDIPGQADNATASDPATERQGATSASDTLVGSTSGDVHTGYGHPGAGMSSVEQHHDGGKKHGQGMQGVGAGGTVGFDQHDSKGIPAPEDKGKRQP